VAVGTSVCPGCGLELPRIDRAYDRKFHASAECWATFEEVIAREFQDAVLFGQAHQLTVDTYAVQHAGGRHPDKSVCVHLTGLYLALEKGMAPADVPRKLQLLVVPRAWPRLPPPEERAKLTVHSVALAHSPQEHVLRVREWAAEVWRIWGPHHGAARDLAGNLL
jgi:hypothetical protein